MKTHAPALLLLFLSALAPVPAQAMMPRGRTGAQLPPQPRDGEGAEAAVVPILISHSIRPYISTDTRGARRWIATPETLEAELGWLKEKGYTSICSTARPFPPSR